MFTIDTVSDPAEKSKIELRKTSVDDLLKESECSHVSDCTCTEVAVRDAFNQKISLIASKLPKDHVSLLYIGAGKMRQIISATIDILNNPTNQKKNIHWVAIEPDLFLNPDWASLWELYVIPEFDYNKYKANDSFTTGNAIIVTKNNELHYIEDGKIREKKFGGNKAKFSTEQILLIENTENKDSNQKIIVNDKNRQNVNELLRTIMISDGRINVDGENILTESNKVLRAIETRHKDKQTVIKITYFTTLFSHYLSLQKNRWEILCNFKLFETTFFSFNSMYPKSTPDHYKNLSYLLAACQYDYKQYESTLPLTLDLVVVIDLKPIHLTSLRPCGDKDQVLDCVASAMRSNLVLNNQNNSNANNTNLEDPSLYPQVVSCQVETIKNPSKLFTPMADFMERLNNRNYSHQKTLVALKQKEQASIQQDNNNNNVIIEVKPLPLVNTNISTNTENQKPTKLKIQSVTEVQEKQQPGPGMQLNDQTQQQSKTAFTPVTTVKVAPQSRYILFNLYNRHRAQVTLYAKEAIENFNKEKFDLHMKEEDRRFEAWCRVIPSIFETEEERHSAYERFLTTSKANEAQLIKKMGNNLALEFNRLVVELEKDETNKKVLEQYLNNKFTQNNKDSREYRTLHLIHKINNAHYLNSEQKVLKEVGIYKHKIANKQHEISSKKNEIECLREKIKETKIKQRKYLESTVEKIGEELRSLMVQKWYDSGLGCGLCETTRQMSVAGQNACKLIFSYLKNALENPDQPYSLSGLKESLQNAKRDGLQIETSFKNLPIPLDIYNALSGQEGIYEEIQKLEHSIIIHEQEITAYKKEIEDITSAAALGNRQKVRTTN